eukprot:gene16292-biopygen9782
MIKGGLSKLIHTENANKNSHGYRWRNRTSSSEDVVAPNAKGRGVLRGCSLPFTATHTRARTRARTRAHRGTPRVAGLGELPIGALWQL